LPKVTVGKFRRASELLERMARENTSRFAGAMGDYRAEHRERNSRPLNPAEAAQLAAALAESMPEVAEDPAAAAAQLQASDLRAYDEPQPQEVLFAAGAATAPAFLELATRFMCLVEMPSDVFKQACREDELDDRLDEAVAELDDVDVAEARERAGRALAHFSGKVGVSGPKAWELLGRTIVGSLLEAAKRTSPSTQSSLTSSAASTPASPETTSSSGSPSAT
jgi:hypothetical protein